jgi:hypothetical protein
LAIGAIEHGWAFAEIGHAQEDITQIRQGIIYYRAQCSEVAVPHYLSLLAEAHGRANQPQEGLEVLVHRGIRQI